MYSIQLMFSSKLDISLYIQLLYAHMNTCEMNPNYKYSSSHKTTLNYFWHWINLGDPILPLGSICYIGLINWLKIAIFKVMVCCKWRIYIKISQGRKVPDMELLVLAFSLWSHGQYYFPGVAVHTEYCQWGKLHTSLVSSLCWGSIM